MILTLIVIGLAMAKETRRTDGAEGVNMHRKDGTPGYNALYFAVLGYIAGGGAAVGHDNDGRLFFGVLIVVLAVLGFWWDRLPWRD